MAVSFLDLRPRFELHLVVRTSCSPVELLTNATGFSGNRIKRIMANGSVWLEYQGRLRRLRRNKSLPQGSVVHVYYDRNVQAARPKPARLIADEGHYSVWDKPPGMYSQGSKWGDHCSLVRWAEQRLQRTVFLVHRLDRAASGLIMVAHDKKTAAHLAALFRCRKVEKYYRVEVQGCFSQKPLVVEQPLDGKPAITHIRRLAYFSDTHTSVLQVRIETGRKHQIRRHLAGLGFPVVGDRLYGMTKADGNLRLRAVYLAFESACYRLENV